MSVMIGDLVEKKMSFEWRVPGFFSLPSEEFWSPVIFFAGEAYQLSLFPNGQSTNQTQGNVGFYLKRMSCGPPRFVTYTIGLRNASGNEAYVTPQINHIFSVMDKESGYKRFLERSTLLSRKDQLVPDDTLTVVCNLKAKDEHASGGSLSTRLWNLSRDLATVMSTRENADITLKLPDGELDAHKMIMKVRSPVLGRMFSHDDLKESQTGEVKIEEGDKESFDVVLAYIYTGDPRGLSPENVMDVYKISHKYDLPDLTRCCDEFLLAYLSAETICDVVRIAFLYQDKKLMDGAKDYFIGHRNEIVKTEQWEALKEENLKIVYEMVEYAMTKV